MASSHPIPPVQKTQALSNNSFLPPPLDGSLSISEILDWHIEHSPDYPVCIYAEADGTKRTITWRDMVQATYNGSKTIRDRMHWPTDADSCIIGILSPAENLAYFATMMSIIRAGYSVFAISPRNSAVAVAHLMKKAGVKHLLVGQEQSMVNLANEAFEQLDNESFASKSPMLVFEDLFSGPPISRSDVPYFKKALDEVTIYVHSSGSTAFPKVIPWTNRHVIELALGPWFSERDLSGSIFSVHSASMFHGLGLFVALIATSAGAIFSVFEPSSPPVIPTPDSLIKAARDVDCDYLVMVPSFLEMCSRNPEYVEWLATRKGVIFGGGPLSRSVGDFLTSKGVTLFSGYGTNETGFLCVFLLEESRDWEYMKLSPQQESKMVPYGDNTFELVVVETDYLSPCLVNTNIDGKNAYATSDLFVPHPEIPDLWRIFGRSDDQIMHSTGEKTNPGPLENLISHDPHVLSSVVFGRQRFNAGVLVDLQPEYRFDTTDEKQLAEWRNKIWPSIEKANSYAPQHSRIFKEMVTFSSASKPFSYTAKNTPRRHAIINEYVEEIDRLYDAVEESSQPDVPSPSHWDVDSVNAFVRAIVDRVLIQKVKDEDDLFENGCDSLQATWIRNTIVRALRDNANVGTRDVSESFIYSHPTVARLSRAISDLVLLNCGKSITAQEELSNKIQTMNEMVEKYSKNFPAHTGTTRPIGEVVLLTGTTGGFGCHLLAKLVENQAITMIYALNRLSKDSELKERQRRALAEQGLDPAIVEHTKIVLVEADLNALNFGLEVNVYQRIHGSVTQIIHNAWHVNFNLSLSSFEPNVKSVRQLVDFALTSPLVKLPKVSFTSSVGVLHSPEDKEPIPEHLVSPQVAVSNGYAESKWVCEQILNTVATQTPLKTVVIRVGQLCGDKNGCWNAKEWFPSIIQAAPFLGCLPSDNRSTDWIPSDLAALAMVDFIFEAEQQYQLLHLVHPRTVSWYSLASLFAQKLSLDLVSFEEWVSKLETLRGSNPSHLEHLSALQLIPSYRAMASGQTQNAFGMCRLDTSRARTCSQTLADEHLEPIGEEHINAWIGYWSNKKVVKRNM